MKVRVTARARRHIEGIHAYISEHNPRAANRVVSRIRETLRLLGAWPYIGHKGLVPWTMEKNVVGLPYVIVYTIDAEDRGELIILGVFHGAQDREHAQD